MEYTFLTSGCQANLKVRYVMNLLRDGAKDWWKIVTSSMRTQQLLAVTSEDFMMRFRASYVPQVEVERITKDFIDMEQTI